MRSPRSSSPIARGEAVYEQIVGQLVAAPAAIAARRTRLLALVGCRPGDGVTHVTETLAEALAARSGQRVLLARGEDLASSLVQPPDVLLERCQPTRMANLWTLQLRQGDWTEDTGDPESAGTRDQVLSALAAEFSFCLLDCGAVTSSGDLWRVAGEVDDVLLVVSAGETTRDQIHYAQRVIAETGARLAGCILNKRTYPLPAAVHRVLR